MPPVGWKGTLEDRFWSKVEKTDTCWLWTAAKDPKGYGRINVGGYTMLTHRLAYELVVGQIPEGLQLDHLCRNPGCVNPAHLEPVTNYENSMRGESLNAQNARKEHCKRGHSLSGDNLYITPTGGRNCKACRSASRKQYYAVNGV